MTISVSSVPEKQSASIRFRPSGRRMARRPEPWNASVSMVLTLSGRLIRRRERQFINAPERMARIPCGSRTDSTSQRQNAPSPISRTPSGTITSTSSP